MHQFNSVYDNMSPGEIEVCNYINSLGLWWQYEQPVFVFDDKQRPRVWSPDFYIPELGVYIEVANSIGANYNYRYEIYRRNKIPIVFISTKSPGWKDELYENLHEIHQSRWEVIKQMKGNAW